MHLLMLFDALKIHKVRHERTVQIWFVLLYGLNLIPYLLPFADRDFSRLQIALTEMLQAMAEGTLSTVPSPWTLLSDGNLVLMGLAMLASLITLFFGLVYAALIVAEPNEGTPGEAVRRILNTLPRLFLLLILLIVPAFFSAFVLFIPLIIFGLMMYCLPLYLAFSKKSLTDAMRHSYDATKGHKLMILLQLVLLMVVITFPQNLILSLVGDSSWAHLLILTFFQVFRALAFGRLMGRMYLLLVKKLPLVVPSSPK